MTAMSPPVAGGDLRGQTAGTTAISTVGKGGVGLTYRGYAIADLAGARGKLFPARCGC